MAGIDDPIKCLSQMMSYNVMFVAVIGVLVARYIQTSCSYCCFCC